MRFVDRYPIIVTPKLFECRDFWRRLGFEVVFEASWFVYLQAEGASLAFMHPDHPSSPPGPETFPGEGMCLELQVEDAGAAHAEAVTAGLPITLPLTQEAFGQKRFGFHDPSGLWVDVVEQTESAEGFWEQYAAAAA
ncbi:VOC family protein [Phenylobacterium sp.]|uniref:VOC family protein n=1 Tax=Phenylobacterium sp. TaxID=1871053 RepID=UPI002ED96376